MTTIALMTHLNLSSKVVNCPDALFFQYGTNLLIDGHFEFSNGLWIVLIHVVLKEIPETKIWGVQIRQTWKPLKFMVPTDQLIRELMVLQLGCWLYMELLHLVRTIAHFDSHHDVFQGPSRTCSAHLCDSDCLLVCIFKPGSSSILFLNHWHITKCFSISVGVSLCLI